MYTVQVDGLLTEVAALKALVITSTPSKPNRHLHPQLDRKKSLDRKGGSSAPGSPAKERMVEGSEEGDIKVWIKEFKEYFNLSPRGEN